MTMPWRVGGFPDCNPLPNSRLENRNGAIISVLLTERENSAMRPKTLKHGEPQHDSLVPQEEPYSVLDLENRVSRQASRY